MNLPALIDTEEDCEKLFEMLDGEPLVAMDSEFVWCKSYYPFMGLIQIGISPEKSYMIDAAALPECPKSFKRFLENEKIMKVCHDAHQDIQIVNYYAKTTTKNVLDTQLAAAFTGFGKSISLSDLVEMSFGKALDKSEQRGNWVKRPLSDAQIQYALDDVRYLTGSAKILIEIAKAHGVWEWILDDCRKLSEIEIPFDLLSAVEKSYAKEVRMVAFRNRPKLYRLCYAIEEKARAKNLPRSFLFKPGKLADIVNCNPENPNNLKKTGLSPKSQKKYAQFFAKTINDESIPLDEKLLKRVLSFKSPNSTLIGTIVKEFSEILEKISEEKGIEASRIYNKKELTDLVRDTIENKKVAPLCGWRNVFLGEAWNNFWIEKHDFLTLTPKYL
jgi:ribonuclease D